MLVLKILLVILSIQQTNSDKNNQNGAESINSPPISEKIFWKDENMGAYVIDDFSTQNLRLFRVQLASLGMKLKKSDEYNVVQSYHSPYVPKRYKTHYMRNLTRKIKELFVLDKNLSVNVFQDIETSRSDFNPITERCIKETSSFISITFLNKYWNKNDYGDIAIYDEEDEILTSIHPKYGRVILMRCGIQYRIGPPALRDTSNIFARYIEFTLEKSTTKITGVEDQTKYEDLSDINTDDTPINDSIIDFSPYLTKKVETPREKKPIYIFDNLIPKPIVDRLSTFEKFHSILPHTILLENDRNKSSLYRGTNLLTDIEFNNFHSTDLWKLIKRVTTYVANGVDTYTNYSMFATHVRRSAHCFVHTDSIPVDNEYTSVIYLTKDWEANKYGETIYLEDNNLVLAVVPKYGRLVVFEGSIEHTSRPPSPNNEYQRSSFVIKTSNDTASAEEKAKKEQNCCPPWDPPII